MKKKKPTGRQIVNLAKKHLGERYVLGVVVPKDNRQWKGPWDCAEFTSWTIFQTERKLYGCNRASGVPTTADAYTGFWGRDARKKGHRISVKDAAGTPGAMVLRVPKPGRRGHIVISDGKGGTIEAHSTKRGVICDTLSERRWDMGILVPGIQYNTALPVDLTKPSSIIYRWKRPIMKGPAVKKIQRALKKEGYDPGRIDGKFGPKTQAAVVAFQASHGMVPDGEVGPLTAKVLGIQLPKA